MYSGHRDTGTQKMLLDIDYTIAHNRLREEITEKLPAEIEKLRQKYKTAGEVELNRRAYSQLKKAANIKISEIILPVAEIVSVNKFDVGTYRMHFEQTAMTGREDSGSPHARS